MISLILFDPNIFQTSKYYKMTYLLIKFKSFQCDYKVLSYPTKTYSLYKQSNALLESVIFQIRVFSILNQIFQQS